MRTALAGGAVAVSVLLAPLPARTADRPWIEVKSPHFTVVSNASDKSARRTGWEFEQLRAAFQGLWPWARISSATPIVLFALKDEASLRALAPQYWEVEGAARPAGVAIAGPDQYYVGVRVDLPPPDPDGISPLASVYGGYARLSVESSLGHDIPLWFDRGVSELFADTIVRDKDVLVGRAIRPRIESLGAAGRLRMGDLLAADARSKYATSENDARVFDAESWALVHFLTLGNDGANAPRLNRLADLLREGQNQDAAWRDAFGDMKAVEDGFTSYLDRARYVPRSLAPDAAVASEAFPLRRLSAAESAAARAAFLAATNRPDEARSLIDEARKADPALAAADEAEGLLLDREGKGEEAAAAFSRAVDRGSVSYYACYRSAQALWRADADHETLTRMEGRLDRAVKLNFNSAASYALLADVKSQLDGGETALGLARRAVSLEPRNPDHRLVVARVLDRLGRRDEARKEAEAALTLTQDPARRRQAEELLGLLRKPTAKN
jgi:tetratricopeptide (TPR) repeat protein